MENDMSDADKFAHDDMKHDLCDEMPCNECAELNKMNPLVIDWERFCENNNFPIMSADELLKEDIDFTFAQRKYIEDFIQEWNHKVEHDDVVETNHLEDALEMTIKNGTMYYTHKGKTIIMKVED